MITHNVKIWPQFFDDVQDGRKPFEYRRDDRPYEVGDIMHLSEYRPGVGEFTGRAVDVVITYVMRYDRSTEKIGLPPGYCILGIRPVTL